MTSENGLETTPTGWAPVLGAWGLCLALFLVFALGATVTRSGSWETAAGPAAGPIAMAESPATEAVPEHAGRLQLAVDTRIAHP